MRSVAGRGDAQRSGAEHRQGLSALQKPYTPMARRATPCYPVGATPTPQ